MNALLSFERLLETAELIARHVEYPGKRRVVDQCREEVEDLARDGRISADQGRMLQEILLGLPRRSA